MIYEETGLRSEETGLPISREVRRRAPRIRRPETQRTALYRHYDREGNLLYVGITNDPHTRFKAHAKGSRWADQAVTFSGQWFDTRAEARKAESEAIKKEKPIFNIDV